MTASPAAVTARDASEPGLDLERWRQIKENKGMVPAGASARDLLPELLTILGSVDPTVRDGIGYEVVVSWVEDGGALDDEGIKSLAGSLRKALRAGLPSAGESDATFKRSFAALALSVIALRDVKKPVFDDAERAALLADALWYARSETDLRGHTGGKGWCHAAAHTGDLLKFLARNPRVSGDAPMAILEAVQSLVGREHGYILHHGENLRLAAPILELLGREAITTAQFEAWLAGLTAPLSRRNQPFDAKLYAIQRNTTNLLLALIARFELMTKRGPAIEAARESLLRALRG